MVFKFISNLKNSEKGTTLVEIAVVLFIIALFFTIMIIGLPEIQRRFALSRATYRLAQDLRKARDLSISGVKVKDNGENGGNEFSPSGYGIYINKDKVPDGSTEYVIYADVSGDQTYNNGGSYDYCKDKYPIESDCVIDIIDVSKENPSLYIKEIDTVAVNSGGQATTGKTDIVSINFLPPNPDVKMTDPTDTTVSNFNSIEIVLGIIDSSSERKIFINKAGLINIQ